MSRDGTVVHRAKDAPTFHACRPPDCYDFAGRWVLDHGGWSWDQHEWTAGDVWRCRCGRAWEVSRRPSGGLWDTWVRSWEHDGPAVMSTGQTPDPCPFPKFAWFGESTRYLLVYLVAFVFVAAVQVVALWVAR